MEFTSESTNVALGFQLSVQMLRPATSVFLGGNKQLTSAFHCYIYIVLKIHKPITTLEYYLDQKNYVLQGMYLEKLNFWKF